MAISTKEDKKMMAGRGDLDVFREMMMKYGIFDLKTARGILDRKIKGELSETVIGMREEE